MADMQESVVEEAANSIADAESVIPHQLPEKVLNHVDEITVFGFDALEKEHPPIDAEYMRPTVSVVDENSGLVLQSENVCSFQAAPSSPSDISPVVSEAPMQTETIQEAVAPTEATILSNENVSPAVTLPASMLLGSIANFIDTSAGNQTNFSINDLQNNPSLMNVLNSAEVQSAIQNNQHITIVQVPDRSLLGDFNNLGDKNFSNLIQVPSSLTLDNNVSNLLKTQNVTAATIPTANHLSNVVTTTPTPTVQPSPIVTAVGKQNKSDEKKKPRRAVTRSGRVSKPPTYRVRDYKTLRPGALAMCSDSEEYSDYTPDDEDGEDADRSENVKYPFDSERPKRFQCDKCDKSYIGRAGLARHYRLQADHGSIEDIPEPAPTPTPAPVPKVQVTETDRPMPRRRGRPPRLIKPAPTSAEYAVNTPNSVPTTATLDGNSMVQGDGQSQTPSDVKVIYQAQTLGKRKQRIKELLKTVGDEDLLELVLPRLSKVVTVWEFLLMKVEKGRPCRAYFPDVYKELGKIRKQVQRMAVECLEKAEQPEPVENSSENEVDENMVIEDEVIANLLGIETGCYKVKSSMPEVEFKYKLLVTDPTEAERMPLDKRTLEVVSQDELVDQSPTKKRKVDCQPQSPSKLNFGTSGATSDPTTMQVQVKSEDQPRQVGLSTQLTYRGDSSPPPLQPLPLRHKQSTSAVQEAPPSTCIPETSQSTQQQTIETTNSGDLRQDNGVVIPSTVQQDSQLHTAATSTVNCNTVNSGEVSSNDFKMLTDSQAETEVNKPCENSIVTEIQVEESRQQSQHRVLMLPPGFNLSKTQNGYAIDKPDGTTWQITGEGSIPLDTIQALLNMDTPQEIFQAQTNTGVNHEHSEQVSKIVEVAQASVSQEEMELNTQNVDALAESHSTTSVLPDINTSTLNADLVPGTVLQSGVSEESQVRTVDLSPAICSESSFVAMTETPALTNGTAVKSVENSIV